MPSSTNTQQNIVGADIPVPGSPDWPGGNPGSDSGSSGGGGTGGDSPAPAATTAPAPATMAPGPTVTILASPTLHWYYDDAAERFYAAYTLASGREMIFEADWRQMDAIFGSGVRPSATPASLKSLTTRPNVTYSGNIAEMDSTENPGATFEAEVQKTVTLALDEGTLPDWAKKDNAAMDILYIAQSEGKSTDWMLEKLSGLASFKQRFPGLETLQKNDNLSLGDAISGFLEFEAGTRQALLGIGQNSDSVTPQLIGSLLNKGFSLTDVKGTVQNISRATKFKPALDAFNSILHAQGFKPLTSVQEVMDFMGGKAPTEMYDLWEASSVAEAAKQAGLGQFFTAEDAINIALETDQTIQTATQGARKASELLLRLRHEVDVTKFGLTEGDLIDLSFGRAPRSGVGEASVMEKVNRATQEAQGFLKKQGTAYKGYASGGRVQSQSLGTLRQVT